MLTMLTPGFASGKSVNELIFAVGPTGKKSNFSMLNRQAPKILKKPQSGREKVSIIMYRSGTRKFHPWTRIISSETRQSLVYYKLCICNHGPYEGYWVFSLQNQYICPALRGHFYFQSSAKSPAQILAGKYEIPRSVCAWNQKPHGSSSISHVEV